MNFINVNTTQNGNRPTSNANYIGLVYSNVLNSSLSFYLPLTGGILSSNLGIGNSISSLNNLNILNVNSFIVASSNITACSNMITSNINSISINNAGVLTTSTITQLNKNPITLRGLITSESNISFNQNNDILSLPVINASLMGGSGSRIIFKAAKNISSLPDAIGLNTDTLWISSSNLLFYINNENRVTINSNGVIITSNQINQLNPGVNNFFMGKVGIATSTESSYNLNVNGSLNATSITINGSSISSSISDVITNSSNYASNISNVLLTNYNSLNTTTNTNISNYALNISNILTTRDATNLINTSNYASNISNVLLTNYNSLNTITNTNISNYALNISNILTIRDATNLINTSNYASNISNVLLTNYNSLNTITNTNSSNYASNISNVLLTNYNSLNTITNTNTSNYASNISNVLLTNYNSLNTITNTNTSNYASNISNVIIANNSNFTFGTSNILRDLINTNLFNTSNYASNISNILTARDATNLINTSNYASNISNILLTNYNSLNTITNTNTSNYASNISNIIATNYLLKSGGAMTGQITGITTLNGTTGIFGTIATTNNTNQAIPALGVAGGVGDKYIIQAGTASTYPYSIGFESNSLWISSPNTIKLYNNGVNSILINSSGNVGIGTTDPKTLLNVYGKTLIHNGLLGTPANGTYGNDGTRIILWPGTNTEVAYSLGITGGTLWYACPSGTIHAFYVGTTERMKIDSTGTISCTGNINMGTANNYPDIRLGSTNGNNLAIATAAGAFSTSAAVNDMVIRSINRLILQSGSGGYGILIDASNKVFVNSRLHINTNAGNGVNSFGLRICSGGGTDGANFFCGIGLGHESGSWSKSTIGHVRMGPYDTGDLVFLTNNTWNTADCTMSDERMRIKGSGEIQISSYLKVNGYYYESSGYTRVYMTGQGYLSVIDPYGSVPISIKTSQAIWAGTHLHYSSDIRIKTEINNIIDDSALRKILAIEPKTYKYIDKITRSNNVVYGFIAQQIREIIPEAVSLEKEVIPNIFKICNCENDEIILDNNIISSNLSINDKIDIYDINNNKKQYKIVNILDNKIKINESINSSNCFVYGKEVDDFHALNKDYIFTLNVCATQELHRIIQGLQTIIQNQQNQINLIKSHLDL
jgi:hypothetical protein